MNARTTDLKKLESYYEKSGNQMLLLYGRRGCQKEELIKEFVKNKKHFYYRCRQASALEQRRMMGKEIERQFDAKLQRDTYDEYFNRIKSGDPSKLVVVIDEAQYVIKKDPEFIQSIVKLRMKRLYPGPVLILLVSSSLVWARQEAAEAFGEDAKRIDGQIEIENYNFLEAVRAFPRTSVRDCIKIYGVLGGVPAYLDKWDETQDIRSNICRLVLSPEGALFTEAENVM